MGDYNFREVLEDDLSFPLDPEKHDNIEVLVRADSILRSHREELLRTHEATANTARDLLYSFLDMKFTSDEAARALAQKAQINDDYSTALGLCSGDEQYWRPGIHALATNRFADLSGSRKGVSEALLHVTMGQDAKKFFSWLQSEMPQIFELMIDHDSRTYVSDVELTAAVKIPIYISAERTSNEQKMDLHSLFVHDVMPSVLAPWSEADAMTLACEAVCNEVSTAHSAAKHYRVPRIHKAAKYLLDFAKVLNSSEQLRQFVDSSHRYNDIGVHGCSMRE